MSDNGTYKVTMADDRCMVVTLGPLSVPIVGKAGYTAESAKAQAKAIEAHGRASGPRSVIELSVLDCGVPIPDGEVRKILDDNVPVIAPYYNAVAAVFTGTGFRASVIRSVIASFQLLSRTPYPQKVYANIDDAADFAYPYLTQAGMQLRDRAALASTISSICMDAAKRGLLSGDTLRILRRPLRERTASA